LGLAVKSKPLFYSHRKKVKIMPYASNADLPSWVKKYPKYEQDIWRKAFNSAYGQYKDEATAFKVANSAVKKYREKEGG